MESKEHGSYYGIFIFILIILVSILCILYILCILRNYYNPMYFNDTLDLIPSNDSYEINNELTFKESYCDNEEFNVISWKIIDKSGNIIYCIGEDTRDNNCISKEIQICLSEQYFIELKKILEGGLENDKP